MRASGSARTAIATPPCCCAPDADYEIDLPMTVTPLGAVARLEHALDEFRGEQERYRQRLADARRRLASYQSRRRGEFAFADELAGQAPAARGDRAGSGARRRGMRQRRARSRLEPSLRPG